MTLPEYFDLNTKAKTQRLRGLSHSDYLYARLQESPTGRACGYTIRWTNRDGNSTEVSCDGAFTERDARKSALRSAIRTGWTYPRWWQWWRWNDTRPDLNFQPDHAASRKSKPSSL